MEYSRKLWILALIITCASCYECIQIISLSRNKTILAGGLKMQVYGSGFHEQEQAKAVITIIEQKGGNISFDGETCIVFNSNHMTCLLPQILLSAFNQTDDITIIGQFQSLGDITAKVGVQFLSDQSHLQHQEIAIAENPDLSENKIRRSFAIWTNDYLTLHGIHLNSVASIKDYEIKLNELFCNVTALTESTLICDLPRTTPKPNDGLYVNVIARVGYISQNVGKVCYKFPEFETPDTRPVLYFNPDDISNMIKVHGKWLLVGLGAENYLVRFGNRPASRVQVSKTVLYCRGPYVPPKPSSLYDMHPLWDYPQLVISIPLLERHFHVGYVRYVNQRYTNSSRKSYDNDSTALQENELFPEREKRPNSKLQVQSQDGTENGLSDLSEILIISIAGLIAVTIIAILTICYICSSKRCLDHDKRPAKVDDNQSDHNSGKVAHYLDTMSAIPLQIIRLR